MHNGQTKRRKRDKNSLTGYAKQKSSTTDQKISSELGDNWANYLNLVPANPQQVVQIPPIVHQPAAQQPGPQEPG